MTDRPADPDIAWLNAALFDGGGFQPSRRASLGALPVRGEVRRVVPLRGRAAAGAFAKTHDAMSPARLAAGRLAQRVAATPARRALAARGLALDEALGLSGDPARSLLAELGRRMPAASDMAITLGPRRTNRKPVVQLFDADGVTLAYAKVAHDDVTDRLVANEARWLAELGGGRGPLAVPELLDRVPWRDRTVAVIASVAPSEHVPDAFDLQRRTNLTREIAKPIVETTVASARTGGDTRRDAILDRFGTQTISLAPWHGDLSPWNTISEPDRTWVLDWEFARGAMPIGADVWHAEVMAATHLDGSSAVRALRAARQQVPSTIEAVGARHDPDAAFALYLLELIERDRVLSPDEPANDPVASAAQTLLRELLA